MIFSYELMIYVLKHNVDYWFNWTNMANSNIKQMQSRQIAEDQSYQVSRQRNQAQRIMLRDIWEVRVRFCKVY